MRDVMPESGVTSSSSHRWPVIDALRGLAVLAMIGFHFTWDLGFFQIIPYDIAFAPEGRVLSHLIAGTFLFLVGAGLTLAHRVQLQARAFLMRFAKIAGAAALVSLGTYFAMPEEWIFFGVLHCIAMASLLALPFLRAPFALVLLAAVLVLGAPFVISHPVLDQPALFWLGLNKVLPRTNDYVPLIPWFGVVLMGLLAPRLILKRAALTARLTTPLKRRVSRGLARLGRNALPIYLLHQPILMAALWGFVTLAGPSVLHPAATMEFQGTCIASCVASGRDRASCERACTCLGRVIAGQNLGPDATEEALSSAVGICRKEGAL